MGCRRCYTSTHYLPQTEPLVPSPGNNPRLSITHLLLFEIHSAASTFKVMHVMHFKEHFLHRAICSASALSVRWNSISGQSSGSWSRVECTPGCICNYT